MARPTKRTPALEEKIFQCLEIGLSERTAAEFARIDHSTMERWKAKDKSFATTVKEVQSTARAKMTTNLVNQSNEGNTSATIFWLKCRAKDEFTEKQEVSVTEVPDGFNTEVI